jgi:hypothetical protein
VRTIHWPEVIASAWPLSIIPADRQAFLLTARNRPLDSDKARIAAVMDAPVPAAPVVGVAPEMVVLFGVGGSTSVAGGR